MKNKRHVSPLCSNVVIPILLKEKKKIFCFEMKRTCLVLLLIEKFQKEFFKVGFTDKNNMSIRY